MNNPQFIGGSHNDIWVVKDGDDYIMMRYLAAEDYPDNIPIWTDEDVQKAQEIIQQWRHDNERSDNQEMGLAKA